MKFSEYQEKTRKTAIYPNQGNNLAYPALGLTGEAGEVAEKVKKLIRDEGGILSDEKKKEMVKELGDVLWYLAALSWELGISLEDVASMNLEKLADRKKRGKLHGDGDNR